MTGLRVVAEQHQRHAGHEADILELLHVVRVEERLVEWIYCLVYGLLGDEKQSSLVRVIAYSQPLLRRCDQVQQFRRQRFGRLDVYPYGAYITTHPDCRDRNTRIVGE